MADDRDMVTRFLRGDADAVATLDSWISRAAWPYQRRLAHRWDDVLQDVRLEVTRLLGEGKFRGESSLRTYLWRVVSHTCLDQIRSQGKWQFTDLETADQEDGRVAGPLRVAMDDPAERDLLMRVLERASPDCRDLWKMLLLGHSYKEMSLRLQVAEGTLRVRVLRCRERAIAIRSELMAGPVGIPGRGEPGRNKIVTRAPKKSGETIRP
ncbi:MAG: polymerase sigma-70 factor, subfamily [Acidobacteriota bacterium]|nr:polymerase sigma-70 factor, subfamily [Acidobacteriota bacterium]